MSEHKNTFKQLADGFAAEYYLSTFFEEGNLNEILKFHQKTTWQSVGDYFMSKGLLSWLDTVQTTDVLPEYYEKSFSFKIKKLKYGESDTKRQYNKNATLSFENLGEIMYGAFGRYVDLENKTYASAGALYPIVPLLVVLEDQIITNNLKAGCYVFDSHYNRLLLIKSFCKEDILNIERNISDTKLSNLFIAYALDIRRATAKYRSRGYRHALIEAGLMAQNFKISLKQYPTYGECLWSGFNDNAISGLLGVSPRLSPVILMQWFGETK